MGKFINPQFKCRTHYGSLVIREPKVINIYLCNVKSLNGRNENSVNKAFFSRKSRADGVT